MDRIKLLIVDDEKLIREGLKLILSTYEDILVVGLCENGKLAVEFCEKNDVDVVLMDIRMPEFDGVTGTRMIKERKKDIKVLILTTFNDVEYIREALNYGASGYLLKDSEDDLIYEGIKASLKGNVVVHPQVASKMISKEIVSQNADEKALGEFCLTEKERSIIIEIAKGLTNKEIGEKLYLTEGTIKNNITGILSKLELRDRTQIAIFAFKNGLIK